MFQRKDTRRCIINYRKKINLREKFGPAVIFYNKFAWYMGWSRVRLSAQDARDEMAVGSIFAWDSYWNLWDSGAKWDASGPIWRLAKKVGYKKVSE